MRPEGLEPPTLCFEGKCSIHLSYRRVFNYYTETGRGEGIRRRQLAVFCNEEVEEGLRPPEICSLQLADGVGKIEQALFRRHIE